MHHLLSTFKATCLPADHSDIQDSTTTRSRRPVRESPPRGYRRVSLATLRSGTQGKDTGKLVEDRAGRTSRKARDFSLGRHPRAPSLFARARSPHTHTSRSSSNHLSAWLNVVYGAPYIPMEHLLCNGHRPPLRNTAFALRLASHRLFDPPPPLSQISSSPPYLALS